jgi:hypothetical protein
MLRKAVWAVVLTASLPAQSVVPAKAGLVSYAREVYVDGRLVEISPAHFVVVNENGVLRTGSMRAEVLLGPCAAMWIDEQSTFRMISSTLSDIRIEPLSGSVVVATGPMIKGTKVTVLLKTSAAPLDPKGAYRFDAEPALIKVLSGRTAVQWVSRAIPLTAGRLLLLDAQMDPQADAGKFDKRNADAFEKWSKWRAAYLFQLSTHRREISPEPPGDAPAPGRSNTARNAPAQGGPPPMPSPPTFGCGVAPW